MMPRLRNRLTKSLAVAAMLWPLAVGPSPAADDDTLFAALGGHEGVMKIVEVMTELALVDKRTADTFDNTNIPRFKLLLFDQLCQLTNGPCEYKGRDMKASHKTLKIANEQFNALVEDLQIAMERANVPYRTQNRLLAILAPMQRDIVTR